MYKIEKHRSTGALSFMQRFWIHIVVGFKTSVRRLKSTTSVVTGGCSCVLRTTRWTYARPARLHLHLLPAPDSVHAHGSADHDGDHDPHVALR